VGQRNQNHRKPAVVSVAVWSEAERRAFAPPEKLTPTQWAERNRVLPPQIAAEPGPYRASRTPYLTGIMDAVVDKTIEEIVCLKAAQIGWSEATRNILGFWIDNDPGPCLLVMPSEDAARDIMEERIRPLIEYTPAVARHLSDKASDNTKSGIKFDSMSLHIGWAGSPQALASRPCRYVLLDEVDKYPHFSGREADPISLARERTKTYLHRKKVLIGSTPTTRQGHIWRSWEGCGDKRGYYCPCPHCGEYQRLIWTQVKWPKDTGIADKVKLADQVETRRLAWYECEHCREKIEDRHKPKMLTAGVWLSEGQTINKAGTIEGERPKTRRVGFRINAIYSPWLTFSDVAAEGLRSMDDPQRMMNFRNSWLADVFEEQVSGIKVNELRERAQGAPKPGTIPAWAGIVIASADVQKHQIYYVIRAWGYGHRSQLIHFGTIMRLDELATRCLNTPIPFERGDLMVPDLLVVDAGYRTDEVYEFARTDSRIVPVKGANKQLFTPIKLSSAAVHDFGVSLRYIDTSYFKDRLATLRNDKDRWLVHSEITDEYCQHLAAWHKIRVRDKGRMEERWKTVTEGAADHLSDAEVYNIVGAQIAGVDLIPSPKDLEEMRALERQARERNELERPKNRWLGNTSGWLDR
jgi:phage terminase large subunit GpA-like protein